MRWKFNTPLGSCMPRGIPVRKCSGAGGAAAAGVFGDILNLFGTAMTNSSNEYQTTQTNNYNREMFREQLAAQKQQWQDERAENRFLTDQDYARYLENREYESPVNQKNRLLQAGINPAFAMSSGQSFGSASVGSPHSAGSTPSSSVPNAPVAQSYQAIAPHFDSGRIAAEAMMRNDALQADISYKRHELDLKALDIISQISNRNFNNAHLKAETDRILDDVRFNRQNWDARQKAIDLANDAVQSDIRYKDSQTYYQNILNKFAPDQQQKILREFDDKHDLIQSQIESNNADSAYKFALEALTNAQKKGVNMDNQLKEDTADAYVDSMFSKAEADYWNAESAGRRYLLGDKVGPTTPAMDLNGKTYSSPIKTYRYQRPWRNSKVRSKVYVAQ